MTSFSEVPRDLVEELHAVTSNVFARAIGVCDASSNLERMDAIRTVLRNTVEAAFSQALHKPNALLSHQNRLPPELWLNIWNRLPFKTRFSVTHVCSRWRQLAVDCAELWTLIDCRVEDHVLPNGPDERYSTLGLIPTALERARGKNITVVVSLDPRYGDHESDRICASLTPHAHEVETIIVYMCSTSQLLKLTKDLHPLKALRTLDASLCVCWNDTGSDTPPLAFKRRLTFPRLELLVLPNTCALAWPSHSRRRSTASWANRASKRFPTLQRLAFAPLRLVDIMLALRDCHNVTTVFLDMMYFVWPEEEADVEVLQSGSLKCLFLQHVPVQHVERARHLVASSRMQAMSIHLAEIPFWDHAADWSEVPHTAPLPSDISPAGASAARNRSGAKRAYRSLVAAMKHVLRMDDRRMSVPHQPEQPRMSGAEPSYVHSGLQGVSAFMDDLGQPLHIDLYTMVQRQADWTILCALTDSTGRCRTAGVKLQNDECMTRILHHAWEARVSLTRVDRVVAELALFPLFVASLPAAELPSTTLLDLRVVAQLADASNGTSSVTEPLNLGVYDIPHCPKIRQLHLGPWADLSERILLSASGVAAFVEGLRADAQLEQLRFTRGIVVDDTTLLEGLAATVVLDADPVYRPDHW